jgi:hypothetical protein
MGRRYSTPEEFLIKLRQKVNPVWDLSRIDYKGSSVKVEVSCKKHGVSWVLPGNLLKGCGCRKCADESIGKGSRSNTEAFIRKAVSLHGDRFDYSVVEYEKSSVKVDIICKQHGKFSMTPNCHLSGKGCRKCADDLMSKMRTADLEHFKMRAAQIHGEKYNYDHAIYKGCEVPIKIECKEHGLFWQVPYNHYSGSGCPSCISCGYNPNKAGYLYISCCDDITKIGITNRDVITRISEISKSAGLHFELVLYWRFEQGCMAQTLERVILEEMCEHYNSLTVKFDGSTECFYGVDKEGIINRVRELIEEELC